MVKYNFTYLKVIEIASDIIYDLSDNITQFNAIDSSFKNGYTFTRSISQTYVSLDAKVARKSVWHNPTIVEANDDPVSTSSNIVFTINSPVNTIARSTATRTDIFNDIQNYITLTDYKSIFNELQLSDYVKTNGLINITNIILNYVMRNVVYVVSPLNDYHYIEYIGQRHTTDKDMAEIKKDEFIRATSVSELKEFIQNNIKNYIKYKIVSYSYSISR